MDGLDELDRMDELDRLAELAELAELSELAELTELAELDTATSSASSSSSDSSSLELEETMIVFGFFLPLFCTPNSASESLSDASPPVFSLLSLFLFVVDCGVACCLF